MFAVGPVTSRRLEPTVVFLNETTSFSVFLILLAAFTTTRRVGPNIRVDNSQAVGKFRSGCRRQSDDGLYGEKEKRKAASVR